MYVSAQYRRVGWFIQHLLPVDSSTWLIDLDYRPELGRLKGILQIKETPDHLALLQIRLAVEIARVQVS